jgi:ribonuclease HI
MTAKIQPEIMDTYILQFDGASRGNPGKCSCGYIIYKNDVSIKENGSFLHNSNTNNFAEYMGFIYGITEALQLNITTLHIQGDSILVLKQVQGLWKVKSDNLKEKHELARDLVRKFNLVTFEHIPRKKNTVADALANKALDEH